MTLSADLLLPCGAQPLQGILSHQLQHPKAGGALGWRVYLHQTRIHQRGEREDDRVWRGLPRGCAYRLYRLHRPATHKDPQRPKTPLMRLCQQFVAPSNRIPHGLLTFWEVSGPRE